MRVLLLILVVLLPLLMGSSEALASAPKFRSVVLIGVDTLRADHLGLYGADRPTSSVLDRIALRARVFDHAYATSPWTLPSFASLLTGLNPMEHGTGIRLRAAEDSAWAADRVALKRRTKMDPDVVTLAERLSAAGFITLAAVQSPNLDPAYGVDRGFDTYQVSRRQRQRRGDAAVRRALSLVDEHADEAFFLFLHLIDPHLDYNAPKPARGRFTQHIETDLKLPISDIRALRKAYPKYSALEKEFVKAAYDEEIVFVDQQIGLFLKGLEERGLADEILFILTSDHGEEFFEHGGFEHGHSMHQELLHVPFLVWGSGITPGRESTPISVADAAPTILEAFGIDVEGSGFGVSLWPAISQNQAIDEDRLIVASGTLVGADQRMALRWPYKLIQRPATGELKLFNLERDPHEKNDLSQSQRALAAELASELERRMPTRMAAAQNEPAELSDEVIEGLRELGYIE